jgi:hypothetical protein
MPLRRHSHETFHEKVKMLRVCIPPHDSGEGGPRQKRVHARLTRAMVRWEGRLHRRFAGDAEFSSPLAPPPPRFAWSPSPTIVGADARSRSRDAICIRVVVHESKASRARTNEKSKGGEAPKGAYHLPHHRVRRVLKRRTLAFRRFTAALVPAVYRQKLSPGRASRDEVRRRYLRLGHRA